MIREEDNILVYIPAEIIAEIISRTDIHSRIIGAVRSLSLVNRGLHHLTLNSIKYIESLNLRTYRKSDLRYLNLFSSLKHLVFICPDNINIFGVKILSNLVSLRTNIDNIRELEIIRESQNVNYPILYNLRYLEITSESPEDSDYSDSLGCSICHLDPEVFPKLEHLKLTFTFVDNLSELRSLTSIELEEFKMDDDIPVDYLLDTNINTLTVSSEYVDEDGISLDVRNIEYLSTDGSANFLNIENIRVYSCNTPIKDDEYLVWMTNLEVIIIYVQSSLDNIDLRYLDKFSDAHPDLKSIFVVYQYRIDVEYLECRESKFKHFIYDQKDSIPYEHSISIPNVKYQRYELWTILDIAGPVYNAYQKII